MVTVKQLYQEKDEIEPDGVYRQQLNLQQKLIVIELQLPKFPKYL